jgi:hypothetical protein
MPTWEEEIARHLREALAVGARELKISLRLEGIRIHGTL